jgi:predicted dehydrogenase
MEVEGAKAMTQNLSPESGAPIGVAVIGTGFGQKVHIPGLKAHHRTEVVAVYHRDPAKAKAIAAAHQIAIASSDLGELLALPQVQGVSISTPPFLHHEQAKVALLAGKHVLLEKPTSLNVQEARELQALAQSQQRVVNLNFEFRCVPAWMQFAELLRQNYVGQPRLVKVDWLVSSRADASRPWNWYAQRQFGGGVLGAIGSHAFDYIHWLFGPIACLSARFSVAVPQRPDPISNTLKPVDAEDSALIQLELANGTPVQISLSAATYQGRGHWVEVYGDQGSLIVGSGNQADYVHGFGLWGSQRGADLQPLEIPALLEFPTTFPDGRIAPFVRIVDRWVQGIDQQQAIAPSLAEGVYSQLLMDLAHESHRSGQWVQVIS